MHILLPTLVALGSPVDAATLTDVGVARSHTPALVVVTPGVDASAYEDWVEVLERRGLDVSP